MRPVRLESRSPRRYLRISVTVASAMNGEKTSTGNHIGHMPCCQPSMPRVAARKPSGTEPESPMKMRALGKFQTRKPAAAPASAAASDRKLELAALIGGHGIGAETDEGHAAREPVRSVHEIVEIGHPHDGEQRRSRSNHWPLIGKGQKQRGHDACAARRTRTESPRLSSRNETAERSPAATTAAGVASGREQKPRHRRRRHDTEAARSRHRHAMRRALVGNVDDCAEDAVADKHAHEELRPMRMSQRCQQ